MSHADIAEAAIGMPQAAQDRGKPVIFGNVLVFLLSLTLHTAALAALWFLAVPALGAGQGGLAGQHRRRRGGRQRDHNGRSRRWLGGRRNGLCQSLALEAGQTSSGQSAGATSEQAATGQR